MVRTTFAAEQARAYGEQHGRGMLYQFTGVMARTRWAWELTRPGRLEPGLCDSVYLRDGLCWSVYLTLARLREAGAPGDVIRLVEQYDPAIEAVIATEYRVRDGAATQVVSFAGPRDPSGCRERVGSFGHG